MLDFNDTAPEPEIPASERREAVRAALLARLEAVLFTLFPAGRTRRGKFVIGDVLGSPGDSLEVVLDGDKAGLWTDRATGDGGDVFHLIGGHYGVDVQADFARVLDLAEDLVGRAPAVSARKRKKTTASTNSARPRPSGTTSTRRGGSSPSSTATTRPGARRSSGPGTPNGARWPRPSRGRCTTSRALLLPSR